MELLPKRNRTLRFQGCGFSSGLFFSFYHRARTRYFSTEVPSFWTGT